MPPAPAADPTSASVELDAAPRDVLAVLLDVEAYPRWITTMREATVLERDADGRPSRMRVDQAAGPVRDAWSADVVWRLGVDGAASVQWRMAEPGSILTALDVVWELEPTGGTGRPAGTQVTYRLSLRSKVAMVGLLRSKLERLVADSALADLRRAMARSGTG